MQRTDYRPEMLDESMKNIDNILDADIKNNYSIELIGRGSRQTVKRPTPGRFCIAYGMKNNDRKICYRVWKTLIPDAQTRYQLISYRLNSHKLKYFAGFRFVPRALKLNHDGAILSGIVMEWLEGKKLSSFLKEDWSYLTKEERLQFIRRFYIMCHDLRDNGFCHGDLSCMNIMVMPNRELRLMDYDSLYVEEMGNRFKQTTGGTEGFQHPERIEKSYMLQTSINDDNFSQLIIAHSLWIAYFNPSITDSFDDSHLIFLPQDLQGDTPKQRLENLHNSAGWKQGATYSNVSGGEQLFKLMKGLESIECSLNTVPSLTSMASREMILSQAFLGTVKLSSIQYVPFCTNCGYKFPSTTEKFCHNCGTRRPTYH